MKKRWNANTWVLVVLGAILLLVGIDVGRRLVAGPVPEEPPKPQSSEPEFKLGDVAPDFTLPDDKNQPRKLSELVKGDTLLAFSCGCNQCREFQTWAGHLMPILGKKAPQIITVNSTKPDGAEAWKRDTKLKQVMLYGSHTEGPVAAYHGSPCPRAFRLDGDRRVKWIGGSRAQGRMVMDLGMELASQLKIARNDMPKMNWESDGPGVATPGIATPASITPPPPGQMGGPTTSAGHGPGDGHNH